jgi:membrane protein DedA with SNARE-associated domain/precorrin-6B methylase 2
MKENFFTNAVNIAKGICSMKLQPGDAAVDATMGNGNDTEFLAKLVGDSGRVYAFDIQKMAVDNTRKRLEEKELLHRVTLINEGHENMDKFINGEVKLVIFNLGYLPAADHNIITKPETTVAAIEKSLKLLKRNGIVIIVIYYGHEGGTAERDAVESYSEGLNQKEYNVAGTKFLNQINTLPVYYIYVFLFISGILQVCFAPYPGATLLIFFGYLGSKEMYGGNIPLFLSFFSSTVISSIALYEIGLAKGELFFEIPFIKNALPNRDFTNIKAIVRKSGILVFFAGKFIPGMNLPVLGLSGLMGCRRKTAYLGIILVALVHDIMFFSIGGWVGSNWNEINKFLSIYNRAVIAVLCLSAAAIFIYYYASKGIKFTRG